MADLNTYKTCNTFNNFALILKANLYSVKSQTLTLHLSAR